MKKTLFFCLIIASYSLQAQTVDDHIRARVSLRIGGNTTTAATGISNSMPGSPSTTLITAKGVYDWFTGVVTFAGDVSGPYNNLVLANTAVTPGTYTNATVTVNSKGLVTSASSGSAGGITALTGDVTASGSGSVAATVTKINGTSLASLATGILKNTTTTGVPSVAVAADFPTLNQNTTGSAAILTTPRNINGVAFDGSANITVTAAAGTLTGGTLASGVTASSLTSFGTSPTLTTPILGTPTSATLTNATGLPLSTGVSGTLPFGNGGTGLSALGTALQYPRTNAGATGWEWATLLTVPTNGALSAPAMSGIGTWITGGTATTTKPYFLIEPTGTTSNTWSTSGTGIAANSASGFTGNLIDLQKAGVTQFLVTGGGAGTIATSLTAGNGSTGNGTLAAGVVRMTSLNSQNNGFGYFTFNAASALYIAPLFVFNAANTSNPALKANGATLETRLGNDGGFAATQSLYDRFGSGSPESVVTAPVGAVYHRTDGGANTSFYVKESGTGNTGWVAK